MTETGSVSSGGGPVLDEARGRQRLPDSVQRALDWMDRHPGWVITQAGQWTSLNGPDGKRYGVEPGLAAMAGALGLAGLDSLDRADQVALLRVEFAPWCIVDMSGEEFEATLHGVNRVTAPCACLMRYALRQRVGR